MKIMKLLKETKPLRNQCLIIGLAVLGVVFFMLLLLHPIGLRLIEGFRIVQLSDLHGKLFANKEISRRVNKLNPDLVAITGDVFASK